MQPRLLLPLVLLVGLVTPSPASGQCRWFSGDRRTPLGGSSPCLCDLVSSCQACWQGCAWNSNCQYFRWADSRLLDWNNTAACREIGAPPQPPQEGTQPPTRPTSGPVPADTSLQLPGSSAAGGAPVLSPSPPPLPPQPSRSALPNPNPAPAADSSSASLSVSLRLAGVTAQQVSEPSAQLLMRRWLAAVMQLGPSAEQQVRSQPTCMQCTLCTVHFIQTLACTWGGERRTVVLQVQRGMLCTRCASSGQCLAHCCIHNLNRSCTEGVSHLITSASLPHTWVASRSAARWCV